jgi:hypothetical protein
MSKITSLKPGQNIECTVNKLPLAADDRDTIARLMRIDPENKKALRRAQRLRGQRLLVYRRGNRDWTSREKCAKVIRVAAGQKWSMAFTFDLANDLSKVEKFISIASK